jgi:hypothetical protein
MTPEQKLNATIQKCPGVFWTRIENAAGVGMPDLLGCYNGSTILIESKIWEGQVVGLRPSQLGWLTKYTVAGGVSFIVAKRNLELHVFDGKRVLEIFQGPPTKPAELIMQPWTRKTGTKYDWQQFRAHVFFGL